MKRRTGLVADDRYLNHVTDESIPEKPERMVRIYRKLKQDFDLAGLVSIVPETVRQQDMLAVHTPEYVRRIAETAGKESVALTPDTMTSPGSYDTAMLAVGGVTGAVAAVLGGRVDNAFALIRPPGHHAERSRALGYCLFNNVAIGAEFARREFGIDRILIVDWDVHHGNGTQHAFEGDRGVFFFSVHQFPHFPGTGPFTEAGRGPGEGYTMNVALPKGYGDGEYAAILENLLPPLAEEFQPGLILVSAGFDTHRLDPMGGMTMSVDGFSALTRCLMNVADRFCAGRLVAVLEGGYHLDTVGSCVAAVVAEMSGTTFTDVALWSEKADIKKVRYAVSRCRHVHNRFWKNLQAA